MEGVLFYCTFICSKGHYINKLSSNFDNSLNLLYIVQYISVISNIAEPTDMNLYQIF